MNIADNTKIKNEYDLDVTWNVTNIWRPCVIVVYSNVLFTFYLKIDLLVSQLQFTTETSRTLRASSGLVMI